MLADSYNFMSSDLRQLAVLIDGDSIDPECLGRVLAEADRHGTVTIRRIYGDQDRLSYWEKCINNYGIESVPNSTTYKNAADVTLIIDAAEILRSGEKGIGGFCIVTSDNDFAGLARWIRKKGAYVVVIWSSSPHKHEPSFEDECDAFMHVVDLPQADDLDPAAKRKLSGWKGMARKAICMYAQEDGWALLSNVGESLKGINPRDYCHSQLLSLMKSCQEFETRDSRWVRLRPTS